MILNIRNLKIVNETPYEIIKGHSYNDSCHDLHANENVIIKPGETRIVATGIHFDIPKPHSLSQIDKPIINAHHNIPETLIGYEVQVRGRSGLSSKGILAAFGTVDCDYTGEVKVILTNTTNEPFTVSPGDRIAQFKMVTYFITDIESISKDSLPTTERGAKGFGSSGV